MSLLKLPYWVYITVPIALASVGVAIWAGVTFGSPTSVKAFEPSLMPTAIPSSFPSWIPTAVPSSLPSWIPTAVPSQSPTATPTGPSFAPTLSPTSLPTRIPTSSSPTASPTGPSFAPTSLPTRVPTTAPSFASTLSLMGPSFSPTMAPASLPTRMPTASATPISSLSLDATALANFDTAISWNITEVSHGQNSSLHQIAVDPGTNTGNVLRVNYPAGSYKPSGQIVGGIGVYASPPSIFPARSVRMSYEVFFPANFDPVKGGKLPGLFIGARGATGGNHVNNSDSYRVMWRTNNAKVGFKAEAYVYRATTQDPSYYTIANQVLDPTDGDSLWRGLVNFNKGSWNTISLLLTVNTMTSGSANPDGYLELTINGVTESFSKMIWTSVGSRISGTLFTTFFGGADSSWATLVYTSTYYKNIVLEKLA